MDRSPVATKRNPYAYDAVRRGYGAVRHADPAILRRVAAAVGRAPSVLNIGAGTAAYEPPNRRVVTIEPSDLMIKRRDSSAAPVVKATVENLPFRDNAVHAAMAVLTISHWTDPLAGLREIARVTSQRAVILTLDTPTASTFWAYRYFPDIAFLDSVRFPTIAQVSEALGGEVRVETVPVTHNCRDGFLGAYWRRPSLYLEARVRRSIPTMAELGDDRLLDGLRHLSEDVRSGAWEAQHGWLLDREELDLGYRLVIAEY